MFKKCPGVNNIVRPELIIRTCPYCGDDEVEFFSYETEINCDSCGELVHREATPSCVVWCDNAYECIDDLLERKLISKTKASDLIKIKEHAIK
ncbi:MAG: hypothetical protein LRZ92_05755 [Methanosarcinaceae archaeon]|jgi:endogenous inhibitor of DNA gyrase (YacG/DUF329 family)|nr:hypothetical protein [Methanosarcinaceae archaeon]NKQ38716.1 hypothetical protein [Methanosarcinales archaeon]